MSLRTIRGVWCLAATLIVGCHSPAPSNPTSPEALASGEPAWLLVRVESVSVSPVNPYSRRPWDAPAREANDGAECGLLGLGVGLINPIAGKGAEYLCQIDSRPKQQEQDPSEPDLVVFLASGGANYRTYMARDSFFHVFRSEFVIPVGAIPADGLSLIVRDRDGSAYEDIGYVRLHRQQLVSTALSHTPLLTLGDPRGGLQRLELVVYPYTPGPGTQGAMNVRDGTAHFGMIRAGEVVEVRAAGTYRIGTHYDKWLTPSGYPGGGPRGYNFENEPFRSAPHGSGIALIGNGDAKMGEVVAPCAQFVSSVGGPLVLGVNDTEPRNNDGQISFSVRVRGSTPEEWYYARTSPCTGAAYQSGPPSPHASCGGCPLRVPPDARECLYRNDMRPLRLPTSKNGPG